MRKYRDEKCLTQSYMANELGIGQSAYQKIEAGESKVSIERLKQIADILGKPLEVFLNKEQDNRSLAEKE
ncbi:helix-turn-helix transcriptional regulator [Pedobacter sp. Du54]|uniref:helix-turn-helix domain-containing protein n=1 Tax=Pedobacter anseongensis TaxID=3133439 RepID=UPI0030B347FC